MSAASPGRARGRPPGQRLRDLSQGVQLLLRPPLHRLRRRLSAWLYRVRAWRHPGLPPRVLSRCDPSATALPHPFIVLLDGSGEPDNPESPSWLAGQTETILALEGRATDNPSPKPATTFFLAVSPLSEEGKGEEASVPIPPTLVESLLLVAACEGLAMTMASVTGLGQVTLLASPGSSQQAQLLGRWVRQRPGLADHQDSENGSRTQGAVRSIEVKTETAAATVPLMQRSGDHFLRGDVSPGTLLTHTVGDPWHCLAQLPAQPGPRTVLFVLPYLAVGGAERLLFDLLSGLGADDGKRTRSLVVTLEPHQAQRGQTVDRCRQLTPYVYTLGDWLPRELHGGAMAHLIRRYQVQCVVSWNGTVTFYDQLKRLRRSFTQLRILDQHYHHRGAWLKRLVPSTCELMDGHVAINRPIAEALRQRYAVPEHKIYSVPHAVALPELPEEEQRRERRMRARQELGLPQEAVICGSFIRLHPQKRPLDILALAQRFAHRKQIHRGQVEGGHEQGNQGHDVDLHFLLAGGGPLDSAVDRQLAEHPLSNLLRLPLQQNVELLYDAVDLCLCTSAYEGLPTFLLDGLAREIPCVATAVGDIPELLAEGGGLTVDRPGDLEALEMALRQLLDPQLRREQGRLGRQRVVRFHGLENYCRRYEAAIFPTEQGSADTSHRSAAK